MAEKMITLRVLKKDFVGSDRMVLSAAYIRIFIGTYETDTMPVIEHYSAQDKVAKAREAVFFFLSQFDLILTRSIVQDR